MNAIVAQLNVRSENTKNAFVTFMNELEQVNAEMIEHQHSYEIALENLKAKHEAELVQLTEEFQDMTAEIEENKKFIEGIKKLLNEMTEPTA